MSDVRYWTFSAETSKAIGEQMAANVGGRIRVTPEATGRCLIQVVPADASAEAPAPLNEGFPCPPWC